MPQVLQRPPLGTLTSPKRRMVAVGLLALQKGRERSLKALAKYQICMPVERVVPSNILYGACVHWSIGIRASGPLARILWDMALGCMAPSQIVRGVAHSQKMYRISSNSFRGINFFQVLTDCGY